jgi:hypothetical protein
MPETGRKGKSLPTKTNADFMSENLGLIDTVKIDPARGTLTPTKPKNNKALKDLIGPN